MDKQLERKLAQMEAMLLDHTREHQELLDLLKQKRESLKRADHGQLRDLCEQENRKLRSISEREKARLQLAGEMTLLVEPVAKAPLRLREIAERLEEPARGRLLVLRQQLAERMEAVSREAGVVRRATESLFMHMQGLVQSISAAVTGVGLYSARGSPTKPSLVVSTFSTTA